VIRNPLTLMRQMPATVRLLVAGTLVNKVGTFIVPYLTLVLERELHLSRGRVATLIFAFGAGSVVSILAGGVLTDRIGRRRTLMLSLFGSGVLAVAMAFAPSVNAFAGLLVAFGFLADLYRPASNSMIADLLPSSQRAVGFAALRMAVNLGFAAGMVLGGLLADFDWRLLFVGDGLTTLGFGAVVLAVIPETRPASQHPQGQPEEARPSNPWLDATFLLTCLASLNYSMVFFVDFTVLPLTVTQSAGYPAIVYGLLVGLNGLLVALFEISLVHALGGLRRLRVAAVGVALVGLAFGMTGQVMHWAWFLLAVVLSTLGEILSMPMQMSFISDWSPPRARGRYLSLYGATWSLALALGPALFLPLHAGLGERLFWALAGVSVVPAVLIMLHLDRAADRPELLRGRTIESEPLVAGGEPHPQVEAGGA
jgi:MFS family permease